MYLVSICVNDVVPLRGFVVNEELDGGHGLDLMNDGDDDDIGDHGVDLAQLGEQLLALGTRHRGHQGGGGRLLQVGSWGSESLSSHSQASGVRLREKST